MAKVPVVLHVDDSKLIRAVVKEIVAYDLKLNLLQASDGEECIALAKEHVPDIIFIDAIMEPMDGWKTAKELKKNSKTKDIPIIMMTGESKVEDIEYAYSVGAVDYIVKPATKDKMLHKMIKVLGEDVFRKLGIIGAEAQPQQAKTAQEPAATPAQAPVPPVAPPPPAAAAVPAPVSCPGCKGFLTWVPAQGWYCYTCQNYPSPQPPAPAVKKNCGTCGKEMTYLFDQKQWYCFECNK